MTISFLSAFLISALLVSQTLGVAAQPPYVLKWEMMDLECAMEVKEPLLLVPTVDTCQQIPGDTTFRITDLQDDSVTIEMCGRSCPCHTTPMTYSFGSCVEGIRVTKETPTLASETLQRFMYPFSEDCALYQDWEHVVMSSEQICHPHPNFPEMAQLRLYDSKYNILIMSDFCDEECQACSWTESVPLSSGYSEYSPCLPDWGSGSHRWRLMPTGQSPLPAPTKIARIHMWDTPNCGAGGFEPISTIFLRSGDQILLSPGFLRFHDVKFGSEGGVALRDCPSGSTTCSPQQTILPTCSVFTIGGASYFARSEILNTQSEFGTVTSQVFRDEGCRGPVEVSDTTLVPRSNCADKEGEYWQTFFHSGQGWLSTATCADDMCSLCRPPEMGLLDECVMGFVQFKATSHSAAFAVRPSVLLTLFGVGVLLFALVF